MTSAQASSVTWTLALLGAAGLVGGSLLLLPESHGLFSDAVLVALPILAAVLVLIGTYLGRQSLGIGAITAAVLGSIPPTPPMSWTGAAVLAAGAVLALEAIRARHDEMPIAQVQAWVLPIGLTVVGLAVPLLALTTQAGRESLDLAQGLGAALSAPFLLLAGAGVLYAFYRRGEEDAQRADEARVHPLLPALGILLAIALIFVFAATASAEEVELTNQGMDREFLVDDSGASAQNVSGTGYSLDNASVALMDPDTDAYQVRNITVESATLAVNRFSTFFPEACEGPLTFELARATEPWDQSTTWDTLPSTTHPRTVQLSETACTTKDGFEIDTLEDFSAWSDGEPVLGWTLRITSGTDEYDVGTPLFDITYETNPPRLENLTTTPAAVDDRFIVPLGKQASIKADIRDPKGGVRNVTLAQEGEVFKVVPLTTHQKKVKVPFQVTEDLVDDEPLVLTIHDWDANDGTVQTRPLLLDREDPTIELLSVPDPETPVTQGEPLSMEAELDDDLCEALDAPCVTWTLRAANGAVLDEGEGNGTLELSLPTDRIGLRTVALEVADRAGRGITELVTYGVREDRAPQVQDLALTGALGRSLVQEQGRAFDLSFEITDESPPLTLTVEHDGQELVNESFQATGEADEAGNLPVAGSVKVLLEDPGEHELLITARDVWGNDVVVQRTVTVHEAAGPVIQLPSLAYLDAKPTLRVTITDLLVTRENVTAEATAGGVELAGLRLTATQTETGLDATLTLPELLHGEQVTVVVRATDDLGRVGSAQATYTADLTPPTIDAQLDPGALVNDTLWTNDNGTLTLSATDDTSEVVSFRIVAPATELDPNGTVLPTGNLTGETLHLVAEDSRGNQAHRNFTVRVDDQPPTATLGVDGHAVLVDADEKGSGLLRMTLHAGDQVHPVPVSLQQQRVPLNDVRRGDVVNVSLVVEDKVGLTTIVQRNLTIQDAPPELTIGQAQGRILALTLHDADGDAIEARANVTHLVNGNATEVPVEGSQLQLPDWHGEISVQITATAHNASVTREKTLLLGERPFLQATAPTKKDTGQRFLVEASWDRVPDRITVVVLKDGVQIRSKVIEETGPGQGQAAFTLDEEGTYQVTVRLASADGDVEVAQAGQVEVSDPIGWLPITLGILLVLLLVGIGVYLIVLRREEEGETEETAPAGPVSRSSEPDKG